MISLNPHFGALRTNILTSRARSEIDYLTRPLFIPSFQFTPFLSRRKNFIFCLSSSLWFFFPYLSFFFVNYPFSLSITKLNYSWLNLPTDLRRRKPANRSSTTQAFHPPNFDLSSSGVQTWIYMAWDWLYLSSQFLFNSIEVEPIVIRYKVDSQT